jgi:PAS domain S-box-containing protein
MEVPGFIDVIPLRTGAFTRLLAAREAGTHRQVLLQMPAPAGSGRAARTWLSHHVAMARRSLGSGVVRILDQRTLDDAPLVVMEGFEGSLLADWPRRGHLDLRHWLTLVRRLADITDTVHRAGLIHRDINPASLMVSADGTDLMLLDFGFASSMPRERQEAVPIGSLQGSLAYMAPEQTGRMTRGIDQRCDLYALGAVAFELACGRPPFETDDPIELVHCHLARSPSFPPDREVHPVVAALLLKLLAKEPSLRYQTAAGVRADLDRCSRELEQGTLTPFSLEGSEPARRLRDRDAFVGRTDEATRLLSALDSVRHHRPQVALVSGPSGIGKTALVESLHRAVTERGGFFVRGKFEQERLGVPYSGLQQAFRNLVRWTLKLPQDEFRPLQASLGDETGALRQIAPDLDRLLGPRPSSAGTSEPGPETQRRQAVAVQHLFRRVASPDRPVLLFLDDLQWSDGDSIRLVHGLLEDERVRGVLVVLAFRDDEIAPHHPLFDTIQTVRQQGVEVHELKLPRLQTSEIDQLLAHQLGDREHQPPGLSRALADHSRGNPFFVGSALQALVQQKALYPDADRWVLEPKKAQGILAQGDIDALVGAGLDRLSSECRLTVASASVLTGDFTLSWLSCILDRPLETLEAHLREAVQANVLDVIRGSHSEDLEEEPSGLSFRFRHDQVQRAASGLLDPSERDRLHARVGHAILQSCAGEPRNEQLLTAVGHLNRTRHTIAHPRDAIQLAALNAQASDTAHQQGSYATALHCADVGLELLGPSSWTHHADLALRLTNAAAVNAALTGAVERVRVAVQRVCEHVLDPRQRITAQRSLVIALAIQGQMQEALQASREGLAWLGVSMPERPDNSDVGAAFERALIAIGGRSPDELQHIDRMRDPVQLAVMDLYFTVTAVAYIVDQRAFAWMILDAVGRSADYGNPPDAAFFYGCMGLIVMAATQDAQQVEGFGRLSLALAGRAESRRVQGRALFIVGSSVSHWTHPYETSLELLSDGRAHLLAAADLEFAGYTSYNVCQCLVLSGRPLHEIEHQIAEHVADVQSLGLPAARRWCAPLLQLVRLLSAPTLLPSARLTGPDFDRDQDLAIAVAANDHTGLAIFHISALQLAVYLEDGRAARVHIDEARQWYHGLAEFPAGAWFHFLQCVALRTLELPSDPSDDEAREDSVERLRRYALGNSRLYAPKVAIVEALELQNEGRHAEALQAYDRAMELAQAAALTHEAALAARLAERCATAWAKPRLAQDYAERAEASFRAWGAPGLATHGTRVADDPPSADHSDSELDLRSLVKTAHMLGSELRLEELPDRLLVAAMENAGATSCGLVFRRAKEWSVRWRTTETIPTAPPRTLTELHPTARAVVNECLNGGQIVQLEDVADDPALSGQPVPSSETSVLCLPLQYGPSLLGALYVENRFVRGAFPVRRIDALRVLCSQAAIALQNAMLFSDLQDSEERFRAIVDSSPDPIAILDREGRLTFIGPAIERMTGYTASELVGRGPFEIVHPDDQDVAEEQLRQLLESAAAEVRTEVRLRHKDGRWLSVELVAKSHLETPAIRGIVINTRDMTQRREAEERLRRAQRLEAVGQLTGGVAHDFNNLLTVIMGNLEILSEDVGPHGEARSLLESARGAVHRGATLTSRLLAFARRQTLRPSPLDVNRVLDEMVHLIERTIPETIELRRLPGREKVVCVADAGQLQNVILNLVVNARDAMPQGGVLTLSCGTTTLGSEDAENDGLAPGRYASLTVADTGTGMPPEVATRIFEPFFTTKEVGRGTGLGLSMAYGFARQSGGTVRVATAEDQGASLTVLLPLREPTRAPEPSEPSPSAPSPSPVRRLGTVLLVEDDPDVRRLVHHLLRSIADRVLVAGTTDAAHRLAQTAASIDLFMADVVLPGQTRLAELIHRVQRLHPDARLLFMSGYVEDGVLPSEIIDGGWQLLSKPFTRSELMHALSRIQTPQP